MRPRRDNVAGASRLARGLPACSPYLRVGLRILQVTTWANRPRLPLEVYGAPAPFSPLSQKEKSYRDRL